MLSQMYLENNECTIFLCNVFPAWQTQHCIVYFAKKSCLLPWANIAQVNSLRDVGPHRSRQHWILFSCAKLFLGFGSTFHRQFSCAMLAKADEDNIVQVIFLVIILHCISNFLVQSCLRRIWTTLARQYSYAMWSQHGRYNIVQVIYLIKVFCLPWTDIAQVISSLCNVDPEKSGHHCILFSNSLNSIISILFTFALAFSIPQVSGSYSYNLKKWLPKMQNLCFLEE